MRLFTVSSLTLLAAALAVSGCGGSDSSTDTAATTAPAATATSTAASTTEPMVTTGMAKCTKGEISAAVEKTGSQDSGEAVLAPGSDSFKCADGWAVAFANVGTGQEQVTTTVVLQAEGQFWVPQDRAKVCPKPSEVPSAIYDLACNSN